MLDISLKIIRYNENNNRPIIDSFTEATSFTDVHYLSLRLLFSNNHPTGPCGPYDEISMYGGRHRYRADQTKLPCYSFLVRGVSNGCKSEERRNTEEGSCRIVVDALAKDHDQARSSDPEVWVGEKREFEEDRMDRLEESVKELPPDNLTEPHMDHSLLDAPSMNLEERPCRVTQMRDKRVDVESVPSKDTRCE